jgi:hypothetical protein
VQFVFVLLFFSNDVGLIMFNRTAFVIVPLFSSLRTKCTKLFVFQMRFYTSPTFMEVGRLHVRESLVG